MPTSYSNPGGSGDRSALISVSTTATLGAGAPVNLVDGTTGNNNSADALWWNAGQSGREIVFDLTATGFKQLIDEITIFQNNGITHGTWKFQGWNGAAWVDLTSTFTLGDIIQTVTITSPGEYAVYRNLQTAGVTSDSPWIQEYNFKIEQGAPIGESSESSEPPSEPSSESESEPPSEPLSEPASEPPSESESEPPSEPLSEPASEPPSESESEPPGEPEPLPPPIQTVVACIGH